MRRRLQLPGPRRISRAALALHEAASSPCPTCGRVTKTTSDGVCADCWAHKDGRRYGPVAASPPPAWQVRLARLLTLRWRPR
jgi:hypothetical protein